MSSADQFQSPHTVWHQYQHDKMCCAWQCHGMDMSAVCPFFKSSRFLNVDITDVLVNDVRTASFVIALISYYSTLNTTLVCVCARLANGHSRAARAIVYCIE